MYFLQRLKKIFKFSNCKIKSFRRIEKNNKACFTNLANCVTTHLLHFRSGPANVLWIVKTEKKGRANELLQKKVQSSVSPTVSGLLKLPSLLLPWDNETASGACSSFLPLVCNSTTSTILQILAQKDNESWMEVSRIGRALKIYELRLVFPYLEWRPGITPCTQTKLHTPTIKDCGSLGSTLLFASCSNLSFTALCSTDDLDSECTSDSFTLCLRVFVRRRRRVVQPSLPPYFNLFWCCARILST